MERTSLIRRLFYLAAAVVFVTSVIVALLFPDQLPQGTVGGVSASRATLPFRVFMIGGGTAGALVLAGLGEWLDRFGRRSDRGD
jgi:hypothetical protein